MVGGGVLLDPFSQHEQSRIEANERHRHEDQSIPAKIAAAIAALAVTAAIMAPTAGAAVAPSPDQVTSGTPISLTFIASALQFLPGIFGTLGSVI